MEFVRSHTKPDPADYEPYTVIGFASVDEFIDHLRNREAADRRGLRLWRRERGVDRTLTKNEASSARSPADRWRRGERRQRPNDSHMSVFWYPIDQQPWLDGRAVLESCHAAGLI